MRVDPINKPVPSFKAIRVEAKDNKCVKYLYNHMADLVTKEKSPAIFTTNYIQMEKVSNAIKLKLEELKIIYKEV